MQLSFSSITLDYYPFHRAGTCLIWFTGNKKKIPLQMYMWADSGTVPPREPDGCPPNLPTGDSCAHWMHYGEVTKSREGWARSLLDEFKSNVEMLKSAVRDLQGPSPGHGSPQHGKHLTCTLFCRTHTHRATSQWVFCPPVSHRDDLYEPLSQAAAEGVGLREVQGSLEWSSHTHLSAQCCWCLQPGTTVCVYACAHG